MQESERNLRDTITLPHQAALEVSDVALNSLTEDEGFEQWARAARISSSRQREAPATSRFPSQSSPPKRAKAVRSGGTLDFDSLIAHLESNGTPQPSHNTNHRPLTAMEGGGSTGGVGKGTEGAAKGGTGGLGKGGTGGPGKSGT